MATPVGWTLFNFMQGKGAPPGQIAWAEFGQMTQSVGWDFNTAQAMFQQSDTDRTGLLNQNEFLAFASRPEVAPHIANIERNMGPPSGFAPQVGQVPMGQAPPQQVMAELDLNATTGIILKQKIDWLEAIAAGVSGTGCCEQSNTYGIYDNTGRPVYIVKEESNCFYRCCCKPYHEAKLRVYTTPDGKQRGANKFTVYKPCKCGGCGACLPFCRMEATVREGESEEGTFIGKIDQPACGGGFTPKLNLQNEAGVTTAAVIGPTLCIGSCCDVNFEAFRFKDDVQGESIGTIKKQGVNGGGEKGMGAAVNVAKGLAQEMFTDADNFVLNYNAELEVNEKVTLMSTLLLLDFMFFEDDGNGQRKPDGSCEFKLFDIYCCGCICPCKVKCGGNSQ